MYNKSLLRKSNYINAFDADDKVKKSKFVSDYQTYFWVLFVCFLMLVIWLAVYTGWSAFFINQLRSTSGMESIPVISGIVDLTTVSLVGSTVASSGTIYQYVGIFKPAWSSSYDSTQTPRNNLPVFSSSRTQASFAVPIFFQNGDILTHSYYRSNDITNGLQPIASASYVFYESYLRDLSGNIMCWDGSNFCQYPISIGAQSFVNLQEVIEYAQETINSNVLQNPATGGFVTLVNPELITAELAEELTQNITAAVNPMIFLVDTQKGTRNFYLPIVDYANNPSNPTTVTTTIPSVDFYIDYGDGSPTEHIVGVPTLSTAYHTYSVSAPATVYVTITGSVVGWNSYVVQEYSLGQTANPMILDIIQWGDVNLQAAGFWQERYMTDLTAGPIPSSLSRIYGFFPYEASPNVWANLETWDISNVTMAKYMFLQLTTGSLAIGSWNMSGIVYGDGMFAYSWDVPVTNGNGTSWRFGSLTSAKQMFQTTKLNGLIVDEWTFPVLTDATSMFQEAELGNLNTANWGMQNIVKITDMFNQYNGPYTPPNINSAPAVNITGVENWDTSNLQDASQFCYFTGACSKVNVGPWNTPNLKNVDRMFWGSDKAVPSFTNWNMQNITSCRCVFKNTNNNGNKFISTSTDYNQVLIDWYTKTNQTNLVCCWTNNCLGSTSGSLTVQLTATGYDATFARSALIGRGWGITDLNGNAFGSC